MSNAEFGNVSPIRLSSPRVGRLPNREKNSPLCVNNPLNASMQSDFSQGSHVTRPARPNSPSGESVFSTSTCVAPREPENNNNGGFLAPLKPGEIAPHPALLSKHMIQQNQTSMIRKRRSSNAVHQSFVGLDVLVSEEDDLFEEGSSKKNRRRLVSVRGRPGRKPIGRRLNMDESIMRRITVQSYSIEDPFELVKKTRERILGECAQNFFKIYIGSNTDDACEINLHYRWWAQYNMFFAHEPMSRLITSTRGNVVEIRVQSENNRAFLIYNTVGLCARSSLPNFRQYSQAFQVKGQVANKHYEDSAPATLNQLLVNVYTAIVHMEHMQQRFIPIGAAITMNNWITLGNPSDVIIALNRLRFFTRIALDYSAGPQINGNTFEKYFPEAAFELREAAKDENHPDHNVVIRDYKPVAEKPYRFLEMMPEIPRSPMAEFVEYWNKFDTHTMIKTAPMFALKMAIRHRLFAIDHICAELPQSIKDSFKGDLEEAQKVDGKPYAKSTFMSILQEVSHPGWKIMQMLLTRQTDTDEEKLLIQNHEEAPLLKLARYFVRSEIKYGESYIPRLYSSDDACARPRNLVANADVTFDNIETDTSRSLDTSSLFDWNQDVV